LPASDRNKALALFGRTASYLDVDTSIDADIADRGRGTGYAAARHATAITLGNSRTRVRLWLWHPWPDGCDQWLAATG